MKSIIPDDVGTIMRTLHEHGYEAYIIGGAPRDVLLDVPPADWDVFTDACGEEIISIFPHGNVVGSEERQSKILTVVVGGIEVSQYRRNGNRTETGVSLKEHLATCDFTINSMPMDIGGRMIGQKPIDFDNKIIRCVGDPYERIAEDKLRALRAVRFAVKHAFRIDLGALSAIQHTNITDIAIERVRDEFMKIILHKNGMRYLYAVDLLCQVLPELDDVYELHGGSHHAESVDEHLFLAQDLACQLTNNPILILACALHDIGKSHTVEYDVRGEASFHNHEKVGAKIVKDIMQRYRFSNANIKYVTTLIAEHMFRLWREDITDRAFVKHFRRLDGAGITIEDYMVLLYSDNQSNLKNPRVKFGDFISGNLLHKKYYELKFSNTPFSVSDLAVTGNDLISAGVPVGPQIGMTLNSMFEAVLRGDMANERSTLMYHVNNSEDTT